MRWASRVIDDEGDPSAQEEMEIDVEEPDTDGAGGAAGDNEEPEAPNARRRFLPSSIGLTVLLDPDVKEIEARISWGDYRDRAAAARGRAAPGAGGRRRSARTASRNASTVPSSIGSAFPRSGSFACLFVTAAAIRSSCRKAPPNNAGAAAYAWRPIRACSATRRRTARRSASARLPCSSSIGALPCIVFMLM